MGVGQGLHAVAVLHDYLNLVLDNPIGIFTVDVSYHERRFTLIQISHHRVAASRHF